MKAQEGLYGYLFALPVILAVLAFTVYPIIAAFWYSFTDYNPLDAAKYRVFIVPSEELEIQYGILKDQVGDPALFSSEFEIVDFVENKLLMPLNDDQRTRLSSGFDQSAFFRDLKMGNLDQLIDFREMIGKYVKKGESIFGVAAPVFVAFKNYQKMFKDKYFWITLGNTIQYALIVVLIQTFLAVILAVVANSSRKGTTFFKLVFFLPSITSSAAISMIFLLVYTKPGILNRLLETVGISGLDWLQNPATALPAVMSMTIWTTAGYFMITFIAGLKKIPIEMYESASIDGASPGQMFWKITLPMLKPQILYVVTMGTIGCLQVFDQIYFLLPNLRNATLAFYIYKNAFHYGAMGYASSIAMMLFLLILLITSVQRKFFSQGEMS